MKFLLVIPFLLTNMCSKSLIYDVSEQDYKKYKNNPSDLLKMIKDKNIQTLDKNISNNTLDKSMDIVSNDENILVKEKIKTTNLNNVIKSDTKLDEKINIAIKSKKTSKDISINKKSKLYQLYSNNILINNKTINNDLNTNNNLREQTFQLNGTIETNDDLINKKNINIEDDFTNSKSVLIEDINDENKLNKIILQNSIEKNIQNDSISISNNKESNIIENTKYKDSLNQTINEDAIKKDIKNDTLINLVNNSDLNNEIILKDNINKKELFIKKETITIKNNLNTNTSDDKFDIKINESEDILIKNNLKEDNLKILKINNNKKINNDILITSDLNNKKDNFEDDIKTFKYNNSKSIKSSKIEAKNVFKKTVIKRTISKEELLNKVQNALDYDNIISLNNIDELSLDIQYLLLENEESYDFNEIKKILKLINKIKITKYESLSYIEQIRTIIEEKQ